MTGDEPRIRREPPQFRTVALRSTYVVSPRLVGVTLAGDAFEGFELTEPAASVRVLLPDPATGELADLHWTGNEFLTADGSRPCIRTLTPRRFRPDARELDVEVVLHAEHSPASTWAANAVLGSPAAVSGPGRGFVLPAGVSELVLGGDESAIPAISQLIEWLPDQVALAVCIEVSDRAAVHALPARSQCEVEWLDATPGAPAGDALAQAFETITIPERAHVWVAGEAAAVQRIRKQLFDARGVARDRTTIRGYWKHGRAGT